MLTFRKLTLLDITTAFRGAQAYHVLGATPVLETDADALRKGAFFQEPGSAVLLLPTQKASPTDNLLTEI